MGTAAWNLFQLEIPTMLHPSGKHQTLDTASKFSMHPGTMSAPSFASSVTRRR